MQTARFPEEPLQDTWNLLDAVHVQPALYDLHFLYSLHMFIQQAEQNCYLPVYIV